MKNEVAKTSYWIYMKLLTDSSFSDFGFVTCLFHKKVRTEKEFQNLDLEFVKVLAEVLEESDY